MTNYYECPECKKDLKGSEIQEWARKYFDYNTHTSKAINKYDIRTEKVTHYECPFCNHIWEMEIIEETKITEEVKDENS